MKTLQINEQWFQRLFPEGFSYPSTTIISGKGGTGKPLVELAFVSYWLRQNLPVIGIPLQYPSQEFVHSALQELFGMEAESYSDLMTYVHFDPDAEIAQYSGHQYIRANLLMEKHWDAVMNTAQELKSIHGDVMLFGAAFNLLLFAPSYKEQQLCIVENFLKQPDGITSLISVSTSAMRDDIKRWENAADNLMVTEMSPAGLDLYVSRMRYDRYSTEKVNMPISEDKLKDMKQVAMKSRERIIPKLKKIG